MPATALPRSDRAARILLSYFDTLSPAVGQAVLDHSAVSTVKMLFGESDPGEALAEDRRRALAATFPTNRRVSAGVTVVIPGDEAWPAALDTLGAHTPFALYVRGTLHLDRPVAVMGSRACTPHGYELARQFGEALADEHTVLVSAGYGIADAAVRGSLGAGGSPVMILACGLDRMYPHGLSALSDTVAVTGALVTEYPAGVRPTRWRFGRQQRLISALAGAGLLVEAGYRSGSRSQAEGIIAAGKPVFGIRGVETSPVSTGVNALIDTGDATAVETAADLRALLG